MGKSMKLALNQAVLFSSSTERFIDLCSQNGIKNIEFRVPKLKEYLYFNSGIQLSKKLKDLDLNVIALNSLDDFGLVPDDNLSLLTHEVHFVGQMCEFVNCPLVIAPVGRCYRTQLEKSEVLEKHVERLNFISDILKEYGVKVGVEPIAFSDFSVHSIHDADEICQCSSAGDAGLIVDYYNLFQKGMSPKDFEKLRSPVHLIHINDADFLPAEVLDVVDTRVFPGDGSLNALEWTLQALEAGYKGCFSLEVFLKNLWEMEPETAMFKIMKKLEIFNSTVNAKLVKEE